MLTKLTFQFIWMTVVMTRIVKLSLRKYFVSIYRNLRT